MKSINGCPDWATGLAAFMLIGLLVFSAGASADNISNTTTDLNITDNVVENENGDASDNGGVNEESEVNDVSTNKEEPTNANPTAPHFSSKAISADDKNPGRIAVQITNIMGNPSIDAQIILDVPDDVEVSGSIGALEGKASYNTIKLDIPAGGVTYVEIPFTAKEAGDYRMSATMYWKWKGDDYLHQIGFDHTVRINKNAGEVCIQKPGEESCKSTIENSENNNGNNPVPDPTSNQILLIIVVLLGIAVIVGIAKKANVIFRHKD